jgi:1,4-alpha-glucan branching enzyme
MPEADSAISKPTKAPWRTIFFRFEAPQAEQVSVVGDFNDWNVVKHPLCKNADGVWECRMPLPAGRYAYSFIVDGTWYPDPRCQQRECAADGTVRCILIVAPPSDD